MKRHAFKQCHCGADHCVECGHPKDDPDVHAQAEPRMKAIAIGLIALCCLLTITNLVTLSAWQTERDRRRNADEHLQDIPVAPQVRAAYTPTGNWQAEFQCPSDRPHIVDRYGEELAATTQNLSDFNVVTWVNEYANLKCVSKKESK